MEAADDLFDFEDDGYDDGDENEEDMDEDYFGGWDEGEKYDDGFMVSHFSIKVIS